MVSAHVDALGVIFPNNYDSLIPELVSDRSMASIPFASRYRMIDFPLSAMVNAGVDNVSILVRNNYHSLMDHLGNGREWDLSRKNGGLNIVPPFARKTAKVYHGRVEALYSILSFLRVQKEKYVILSDSNIAANFDFKEMLQSHIRSGNELTIAYAVMEIPESILSADIEETDLYYSFDIEDDRITKMHINPKETGLQNLSLNVYILERELLIRQVEEAYTRGYTYYERDVLLPKINDFHVGAYQHKGYISLISDINSYFNESMRLLDIQNADALFSKPVYTKIRDDNPTRYKCDAKVENVMVADGCVIEGTVQNCILFRGVKIKKGAVIKNCILMQGTVIEENAEVEYVITDKNVTISAGQHIHGSSNFPVYVSKGKQV